MVGVIDEPIKTGADDALEIKKHSDSLVKFIQTTSTPITIGVQGEWGSGKTSLLNSIKGDLAKNNNIQQIWINSWENTLLVTPEEALIKIVNEIISALIASDDDKNRKDKIMKTASSVFKGAMRIGAGAALGLKGGQVADELMGNAENSIKELRSNLYSLVGDIQERTTNPFDKIVIYVDDLDRIEPKDAVKVLELLKNIFSIPGCIFVLAIDYQVVVKGLEHKFGKQTPENEWEFRAFFDKIIQLPFMMPMGQYNIGKYVTGLLKSIGFTDDQELDPAAIKQILMLTIGGNPRSIKRLVNSVSLIQIFSESDVSDDQEIAISDEKFLLFSLLCIQIAYPQVYSLLVREPNFIKWDDKLAFEMTQRKEEDAAGIFETEFKNAQKLEDFDEEWEKALFRICYNRPRLKPRVTDVSKVLSYIKENIFSENLDNMGEDIATILSKTSVTSVTSTDQGQELPERGGAYKRRVLDGIDAYLLDLKVTYGNSDEEVKIFRTIHDDIQNHIPDASPLYTRGVSFYINKRKFLNFEIEKNKKLKFGIIKSENNNYRIPKSKNFSTSMARKFTIGKGSTVHNADRYKLVVDNFEDYKNNKELILGLVNDSNEMIINNDKTILKVDYSSSRKNYFFRTNKENIEGDQNKVEELCTIYLDPNYTYDL